MVETKQLDLARKYSISTQYSKLLFQLLWNDFWLSWESALENIESRYVYFDLNITDNWSIAFVLPNWTIIEDTDNFLLFLSNHSLIPFISNLLYNFVVNDEIILHKVNKFLFTSILFCIDNRIYSLDEISKYFDWLISLLNQNWVKNAEQIVSVLFKVLLNVLVITKNVSSNIVNSNLPEFKLSKVLFWELFIKIRAELESNFWIYSSCLERTNLDRFLRDKTDFVWDLDLGVWNAQQIPVKITTQSAFRDFPIDRLEDKNKMRIANLLERMRKINERLIDQNIWDDEEMISQLMSIHRQFESEMTRIERLGDKALETFRKRQRHFDWKLVPIESDLKDWKINGFNKSWEYWFLSVNGLFSSVVNNPSLSKRYEKWLESVTYNQWFSMDNLFVDKLYVDKNDQTIWAKAMILSMNLLKKLDLEVFSKQFRFERKNLWHKSDKYFKWLLDQIEREWRWLDLEDDWLWSFSGKVKSVTVPLSRWADKPRNNWYNNRLIDWINRLIYKELEKLSNFDWLESNLISLSLMEVREIGKVNKKWHRVVAYEFDVKYDWIFVGNIFVYRKR